MTKLTSLQKGHAEMSELDLDNPLGRKFAHSYVALAVARDVANRYISEQPAHAALSPLLTLLDVAAKMMEEILQSEPEESPSSSPQLQHSELIM